MNAPLRQFASPYARKLAGERGIALVDLRGSGPVGRIVAADVLAFVKPPAASEPPPSLAQFDAAPAVVPAPSVAVAALATEIGLTELQNLVEQFAAASLPASVDAFVLRAAARNLADAGIGGTIGWERGSGNEKSEIRVSEGGSLSLGALQSRLEEAEKPSASETSAALSICRLTRSGIRAVALPLLPGHQMRLALSISSTEMIGCLLCFDAISIAEDDAAAFLAGVKDDLETPLRLLA